MVYGYALPRPSTPCPASLRPKCTPPLPKRLPWATGLQSPRLWPGKHLPLLLPRRMWLISRANSIARPRCSWENDVMTGTLRNLKNTTMTSLTWTMLLPTRISKPKPGCRRWRGDHKASKAVNGTFKEPKPSLLTAWQGAPKKH